MIIFLGFMALFSASLVCPSGDKKEAGEGNKYSKLSEYYGYKQYANAPTPKLKSEALGQLYGSMMLFIDDFNTIQERKDFLQEAEEFLRENKGAIEKQKFDEYVKDLQGAKRIIERDEKRHAKRRQMPADLEKAIEAGDAKAVFSHLNKNRLDIDSVCEVGDNPLMEALKQKRWNVDMIKQLITRTKNIAFRNDAKETALHLAAESLDPRAAEIVKQLLDKGAAIEARNNRGDTPLTYAIKAFNVPVADVLLRHKASLKNALTIQVPESIMLVMPLPKGPDFVCEDPNCKENHHQPTAQEQIALLALLIKYGLDVNRVNIYRDTIYRDTLLHQAIISYNEPVAKFLLDNKADIEAKDSNGYTPLKRAWFDYNIDKQGWDQRSDVDRNQDNKQLLSIMELLLQRGANKESLGTEVWPPLMIAILHGQLAIVKLLVKNGADIQEKKNSETPITMAQRQFKWAATKEKKETFERIIEYLVQNSPEHKQSQEYKEKVESTAALTEHGALPHDVATLVEEFTVEPTKPSKITMNEIKRVIRGDYHSDFDKMLNEDKAVLELTDEAGDTPLLLAIKYNKPDAINAILAVIESLPEKEAAEMKAKVFGHTNEQGFNADELAKALGNKEIVGILAPYYKQ